MKGTFTDSMGVLSIPVVRVTKVHNAIAGEAAFVAMGGEMWIFLVLLHMRYNRRLTNTKS